MVPSWLVTPTASEAAESDSVKAVSLHMQVNNAIAEWHIWIMVAPDCQSELRSIVVNGALDGWIVEVAARDENVYVGAVETSNC